MTDKPANSPDQYYSEDAEASGDLYDLLDESEPGDITKVTPIWFGKQQWAVTTNPSGYVDYEIFDTEEEAKKFSDGVLSERRQGDKD